MVYNNSEQVIMANMEIKQPLQLVDHTDPVLHQPCERFSFVNPQFDIVEFSQALVDKMRASGGMGLAANQVGKPYRIFAMESEPTYVVINPKIIAVSDETVTLEEGCLSYPGLIIKVKRPLWIKVRFNYPNGAAATHRFEGMTARCFLHEFDHIETGTTFLDRANPIHKERALKQLKKLNRKN